MIRRIAAVLAAVLAAASAAHAGTVSLAWDPVSHPDLAGYRVFFDTTAGSYGNSVDVGSQTTTTTLSGLADCTTHYVAVKAYDSLGQLSPTYSNVISGWARPTVTGVSPAQIARGTQVQLIVDGTNFQTGATVSVSNPGITLGSASLTNCSRLTVTATVAAGAALGAFSVRVVNPDQVYGEATGLVSVVSDGTAPTVSAVGAGAVGATSATITWTTSEAADGRVYFRRQGESGYQSTPVNSTLATAHSITLQGLRPSSTYQFHVTSADAAGNSASSGDSTFTTQANSFTYLRLEAEAGALISPVVKKTGSGVFSGSWVEVPAGQTGTTGSPAGESRLGFHIPHNAQWRLWLLVRGTDAAGAAWYEGIDAATLASVTQSGPNLWEWLPGRTYTLTAGLHTLRLGGRKGEARADRVILTDDPNFTATELPLDDTAAPGPVTSLAASPGDGTNHLSWTNPVEAGPLTIVVRYRTDTSFPLGPGDGFPLASSAGSSGAAASLDHPGLTNGISYRYAVFAVDFAGNVSTAATVVGTPLGNPPGAVENLHRTDALP